MKKLHFFFAFLFASFALVAQTDGYKKWVLLEHFTNTRCGICGSANPSFYNRWSAFPDDIHHISYHPSFPYQNCAIHQSNPTENTKRANYYNTPATPYVYKNGKQGSSAGSTSTAVLNGLVGGTSALLVEVDETSGNNRTVSLKITTHPNGTAPTGNLKLYVAAVEKEYQYNAPNGENVHHNVFRTMLVDGDNFTAAAAGQSVNQTLTYSLQSTWNADEMYVMAWVQNDATKDIFNSGSSLDPASVSTNTPFSGKVQISPNPATEFFQIQFEEPISGEAKLYNLLGKELKSATFEAEKTWKMDVAELPKGIYLVRAETEKGILTKRVLISKP